MLLTLLLRACVWRLCRAAGRGGARCARRREEAGSVSDWDPWWKEWRAWNGRRPLEAADDQWQGRERAPDHDGRYRSLFVW